MCRIFGAALKEGKASPLLKAGLKRLEYGGYDSAGMATIHDGTIEVRKGAGKIDEVDMRVKFEEMEGRTGIAHNRWATHGYPTTTNAHPHVDCTGSIAVVHNGVIENFMELKEELLLKGHQFKSRTDTEVIAHLIEDNLKDKRDFLAALFASIARLRGSYALGILYSGEPERIFLVKEKSPLYIGVGDGAYAASDPIAFAGLATGYLALEDGEVAVIDSGGYSIYNAATGAQIKRQLAPMSIGANEVSKGEYQHYMLKEIMEQPESLSYTLSVQRPYVYATAEIMTRSKVNFLIGAGSSYHSCIAGSYMYSTIGGLPTIPVVASEFIQQYGDSLDADASLLLVSQSGETADVLRVASFARMKASNVMAITNVVSSTITRLVRHYIVQQAGPEIGVAATKTYTSQLLVHLIIAREIGLRKERLTHEEAATLLNEMNRLPELVHRILNSVDEKMRELAGQLYNASHIFYLGRGINTATALEGRLKMLEIAYIPSSAFSAGESKHGPIALIEKNVPAIFIAPRDRTRKVMLGNIMEIKAREGRAIVFGEEGDRELMEVADVYVPMPKMHEMITPIAYAVPLQLLAYYTSVKKGLDPDKPRNLAKSVTVE